jgi:uncharacterized protein with GYD domain
MKFVLLAKVSAGGANRFKERGKAAAKKVAELGIKVEAVHYMNGPYDFVEVVDAPNAQSVLALSVWWAREGYGSMVTMPAHDPKAMKWADAKAR